jgi:hypothetical protein
MPGDQGKKGQQALFAFVDVLAKTFLTCVPEPLPVFRNHRGMCTAKPSPAANARHDRFLKSIGMRRRISRALRSRFAAIRRSAASTPLSRPASPRSIAARMKALWLENAPFFVAASIRLLSSALYRKPWVIAFCFRSLRKGNKGQPT